MNQNYRKALPGADVDFFDARAAVEDIRPGAWDGLPYTSKVLAENLVRRCDPDRLADCLRQLIERKRELDFPWFPARVVCHDILGQTALVDLAGLRDAIAEKGGDPSQVNPVVPTQLIVDHSLAVEHAGFEQDAFEKNRAIEDRRNEDRFHFINWCKIAFENVDVIPPGNGIMHQINLEKMSPVIHVRDGVAFPDTLVGTDSHTPHVDALGVIAIGVGGLEAENVMLGRASYMRLPDIVGRVLEDDQIYADLAVTLAGYDNFLYLGRGINYPIALEGALKLKEISYIHAEGYPAGEMKHGPIALINEDMPTLAIVLKDHVYEKMLSQVEQVVLGIVDVSRRAEDVAHLVHRDLAVDLAQPQPREVPRFEQADQVLEIAALAGSELPAIVVGERDLSIRALYAPGGICSPAARGLLVR